METGKRVAGLDAFGIVREGRARQNAFHLVADVEDDLIGGERDDRALKLFGFGAMGVRALEGGERVGKRGLDRPGLGLLQIGVSADSSNAGALALVGTGWAGSAGSGSCFAAISALWSGSATACGISMSSTDSFASAGADSGSGFRMGREWIRMAREFRRSWRLRIHCFMARSR